MKNNLINIDIPKVACTYEQYDSVTLKPTNDSTYIRLIELGWNAEQFKGKTVLDIGCNTGVLSIYALSLGASKIKAVDVQPPLLSFFTEVVNGHNLPISVENKGFNELNPADDAADIVLLMEVLHWLVDQGGNVKDAIAKLASITNDSVYIETPWDVNEPSIAAKGVIQHKDYNMDLIVGELTKYFEDVKFVRFMTYFGNMKDSRRILIYASKKRKGSLPLLHIKDAYPTNVPLTRGSSTVNLITTPDGPMVLKLLPEYSTFAKLSEENVQKFVSLLPSDSIIVSPIKISSNYVCSTLDGSKYMIFPFAGNLSSIFPKSILHELDACQSPLQVALDVRKILKHASRELIDAIHLISPPKYEKDIFAIMDALDIKNAWSEIIPFLKNAYDSYTHRESECNEAIIHCDIQVGNILENPNGKYRLIDLDLMRSGTTYSDLIVTAIFAGSTEEELNAAIALQAKGESRRLLQIDIIFSVNVIFGWFEAVSLSKQKGENYHHSMKSILRGLKTVRNLYVTCS
jgi:SAM-dependent methyltransferase/thiamine kinase-like enzyme